MIHLKMGRRVEIKTVERDRLLYQDKQHNLLFFRFVVLKDRIIPLQFIFPLISSLLYNLSLLIIFMNCLACCEVHCAIIALCDVSLLLLQTNQSIF